MAIDRTPWNALVDDDGSNLVGTVWNKDKIKTVILDPTDAALVSSVVSVTLNPAAFTANNGATWAVTAAVVNYSIGLGHWMYVSAYVNAATISGPAPSELHMTIPDGRTATGQATGACVFSHAASAWETIRVIATPGTTKVSLHRDGFATFGLGGCAGYFSIVLLI